MYVHILNRHSCAEPFTLCVPYLSHLFLSAITSSSSFLASSIGNLVCAIALFASIHLWALLIFFAFCWVDSSRGSAGIEIGIGEGKPNSCAGYFLLVCCQQLCHQSPWSSFTDLWANTNGVRDKKKVNLVFGADVQNAQNGRRTMEATPTPRRKLREIYVHRWIWSRGSWDLLPDLWDWTLSSGSAYLNIFVGFSWANANRHPYASMGCVSQRSPTRFIIPWKARQMGKYSIIMVMAY